MVQMTLADVPNNVSAFHLFLTSLPQAVYWDSCVHFPDAMTASTVRGDVLAGDIGAARLRATYTNPMTRCRRRAKMVLCCSLCRLRSLQLRAALAG